MTYYLSKAPLIFGQVIILDASSKSSGINLMAISIESPVFSTFTLNILKGFIKIYKVLLFLMVKW